MRCRWLFSGVVSLCVTAGLSTCSAGGGGSSSAAGLVTDQQALTASGAEGCVLQPAVPLARAQYQCAGGLTVTTFASAIVREAMAQVAPSTGERVMKQSDNWMLTADVSDG